jgi:protein involved in polysaccharide export with SLBB domain
LGQPQSAPAVPQPLAAPKPSTTNTLTPQNSASGLNAQQGTNVLTAASTNAMEVLDDKHKLANGDRLSFRIIEDEEAPKQLVVTDSGELEAPYIGRFPAVGRSCKELAKALKAELEKEYYYRATVIVAVDQMAKSRGKVYLVGPVRVPGPQEIPSDEVFTLSKAILRAGGFNDFADKTNVRITRKKTAGVPDEIFIANVTLILEKGLTGLDIPLEAGDFIYVPERSIRF